MFEKVFIIGGATSSNKTDLAIKIASEVPSVVINADSMQVYQDLEILSNRPSKTELEGIENKLFGVIELSSIKGKIAILHPRYLLTSR